jgi:hypothetical protein
MRIPTSIPKYLQIQRNTLGQHLPQFEQRMNLTWPRPCLLRPPFLRLKVCRNKTRGREREIRPIRKKNKTTNIRGRSIWPWLRGQRDGGDLSRRSRRLWSWWGGLGLPKESAGFILGSATARPSDQNEKTLLFWYIVNFPPHLLWYIQLRTHGFSFLPFSQMIQERIEITNSNVFFSCMIKIPVIN